MINLYRQKDTELLSDLIIGPLPFSFRKYNLSLFPGNTFKLFSSTLRRFPSALRSFGFTAAAASTLHNQSPPPPSALSQSFSTPTRVISTTTARMVHSKVVSKCCQTQLTLHIVLLPQDSELTRTLFSHRLRPRRTHCCRLPRPC